MEFFLQLTLNGLVVGSIYALVALGFVIIFKSSGVLNFAQGEFLLLGAYVFWAMVENSHLPLAWALLLTVLFSVVLGLAMERLVLRPMIGEPIISVIMVTLGLSSILRAVVLALWGIDTGPFPSFFGIVPMRLSLLSIPPLNLFRVFAAAILLAGL